MNLKVDIYLENGCGRCKLGGTPQCKVHKWHAELVLLRTILQKCGLTEDFKWSQPCYTFQKKNILILSAFKNYCALNFFKGALLSNVDGILVKPGEHTEAGRQIRFTNVQEIIEHEVAIKTCVFEAIEVEKAGLEVEYRKISDYEIPTELKEKFNEIPALKAAFFNLSPGRQRGYYIYFSQAKQSKTRLARVEKYIQHILYGKGLQDH